MNVPSTWSELKLLLFNALMFLITNFDMDVVLKKSLLLFSVVLTVLKCVDLYKQIKIKNTKTQ